MVWVTIIGFTHAVTPINQLVHPVVYSSSRNSSIKLSAVLAAIAIALFSYNGYNSAINFSEETRGSARNVGRSVSTAASLGGVVSSHSRFYCPHGYGHIACIFCLTPAHRVLCDAVHGSHRCRLHYVVFAVFNVTLAIAFQFSRVIFSTARDESWPR